MTQKFLIAGAILVSAGILLPSLPIDGYSQGKVQKNVQKQKGKKGKGKASPYVHTVIFYLKKDAGKKVKAAVIRDCHQLLAKIPTVRVLRVGRPAKNATPDVAVNDYDIGLTILFENPDGLKSYLTHPLHLQFVDRYQNQIDRVLVYDFSNQKK